MDTPTPEEIAEHARAMGESAWLIEAVIAGTQMANDSDFSKKACVARNVGHLQLMRHKEFWTDEDFTAVDAAIVAGEAYLAG